MDTNGEARKKAATTTNAWNDIRTKWRRVIDGIQQQQLQPLMQQRTWFRRREKCKWSCVASQSNTHKHTGRSKQSQRRPKAEMVWCA